MDVDTYRPEFPELVIYKVLKLLPTKLAVRASIVSKQWRRVWSYIPFLDFDEDMQLFKSEYGLDRKMFLKFLHSCLNHRKEDKQDLDMFKLRMRYSGGLRTIDKCLSFAIERKVKNLDISLRRRKKDRSKSYYLPGKILNNAKYLTSLILENVKIKDETGPISLPSLKTMSLENMNLEHCNTFVQLFSCPSIEGLSLASCNLRHCKVSSPSLKSLRVTLCDNVVLEVEAMNLESLRFWARSNGFPMHLDRHLKIASCRSLRNLAFLNTQFVGRWFEDSLNPRFPLLESLILYKCRNSLSNTLVINSQDLKRLTFSAHDTYSGNAKIHTPNLDSFTLRTGGLPSNHLSAFVSTFSLHAPKLQNANIDVNGSDFSPLRNVLRHFNCSRKVSLSANEAEALIFPEETRNTCLPPLPRVKHLDVALHSSPKVDNNVLMDSFKWMAPTLESLCITVNRKEIFKNN